MNRIDYLEVNPQPYYRLGSWKPRELEVENSWVSLKDPCEKVVLCALIWLITHPSGGIFEPKFQHQALQHVQQFFGRMQVPLSQSFGKTKA